MTERRAACRYCNQEVVLGKHGWRLDNNSPSGYNCPAAPKRYHGIGSGRGMRRLETYGAPMDPKCIHEGSAGRCAEAEHQCGGLFCGCTCHGEDRKQVAALLAAEEASMRAHAAQIASRRPENPEAE